MAGPLDGLRIIEMAGLGPCPLAGQLLADLGAEVILVERGKGGERPADVNNRGKRSLSLNLKKPEAVEIVLKLAGTADALIEGFRPGVMERLGLGPDACLARNPKLVFGRMTGWGQDGPLAMTAGHDLNYLSLTGALHMMGRRGEPPSPPLNLVADYGGGTMFLVFGVLSGIIHASRTGRGQVVDASMVEGVSAMMGLFHQMREQSLFAMQWTEEREANLLDGGAPFYRCYETADGKFVSVAPLEPQFFAELVARLDLPGAERASQYDRAGWPEKHAMLEALFRTRTRSQWEDLFEGSDACVAPVLTIAEAFRHPHNRARGTHGEIAGVMQAMPAPKFSQTPPEKPKPPEPAGASTKTILLELGLSEAEIATLT